MTLLSASELESLERLALTTRSRLLGFFSGDHRSRRFGSSLDFADYREYRPGDDFRRIDAALSARMDHLFLKLFEAEEDLPVRIVLDCSASMGFGDKMRAGARIAAGLAHVALAQHDRVRLYAARDDGAALSRWYGAKADTHDLMRWLDEQPARGNSGLVFAVRRIHEEGRAGMLFLISDLLDPQWEAIVRRLAPPGEAAVVQVLAPEEMQPPLEGDRTLVDAETGAEISVALTARELDAYGARLATWLTTVRSACTSRGIAHALITSDDDLLGIFLRSLRTEAVVR